MGIWKVLINSYCYLGRTFRYTISVSTLGCSARNALLILPFRTVDKAQSNVCLLGSGAWVQVV